MCLNILIFCKEYQLNCLFEFYKKGHQVIDDPFCLSAEISNAISAQLTHRYELFRARWVDSHNRVEVCFGCAHLHCYAEALDHFIYRETDAV